MSFFLLDVDVFGSIYLFIRGYAVSVSKVFKDFSCGVHQNLSYNVSTGQLSIYFTSIYILGLASIAWGCMVNCE